ncbi:MAG: class I SAM-dependent methyltransferase [Aquabacterium sp.]|nr:class I SAM-dependent methyltransferase [Aquabacterium sp.]
MDWTAGYTSDIEYTAGFYREQSPAYLNLVCLLNGYESIATDRPYTYFELGCGRGLTSIILAASNPMGEFYAADFNPAHIAGARDMSSAASIGNLHLIENSFEDLATGHVPDLPQFDFITLHGIYTWVTAQSRQHIVQFIARYLKPGGVVYVSYNAMPGWSAALPLQRLLVEHAELAPGRSDAQMKSAAAFVRQLEAAQAGYFKANTGLRTRLDLLARGNANYLVHEYLTKNWQPLYFADVARDLAQAKLDYVGSAELAFAYPALFFTPDKLDLMNGIADAVFRETLKDYFLNTSFRKDVFVRGARAMPAMRQKQSLQTLNVLLLVPRNSVNLKIKIGMTEINARPDIFQPIVDAIAQGSTSLAELSRLPALKALPPGTAWQVAALLTASGQAAIYPSQQPGAPVETAQRLNRLIASQARYVDDFQALASPLFGSGMAVGYPELLMYLVLVENAGLRDALQLAQHVWGIMQASGRCMLKDSKPIQDSAENLAELHSLAKVTLEHRLPLWDTLRML